MFQRGWDFIVGPLDPSTVGCSAGVAAAARRPSTIARVKPLNVKLHKYIKMGRLDIYSICLCDGRSCYGSNTYAWAGSQHRNPEADKGNQMYHEVRNDADQRPGTAKLLVGDNSASLERYHELQTMITNDGWTDLGAEASRWGSQDFKPTCNANKTS